MEPARKQREAPAPAPSPAPAATSSPSLIHPVWGAGRRKLPPCSFPVRAPCGLRGSPDFVDRGVGIDTIDQAQGAGDRL
jgi:hypothetical protein